VGSSPPSVSAGFVFQLTRVSRRGHGPLSSFSSCGSLVSTDPNRSSTASAPRHHHLLRGGLVSVALPRLSPYTSGCRTSSVREGTSSGVPRDPLSHSVCAAAFRKVLPVFNGFRGERSRASANEAFVDSEPQVPHVAPSLASRGFNMRRPRFLWMGLCVERGCSPRQVA